MSGLPEWVDQIPAIGKWLAGTVVGLAATATAWTAIGGPVPADREWVAEYVENRERIAALEARIATTRGLLSKAENEEVREGLEAQLHDLQSELDALGG